MADFSRATFEASGVLFSASPGYLDTLYELHASAPHQLSNDWNDFFVQNGPLRGVVAPASPLQGEGSLSFPIKTPIPGTLIQHYGLDGHLGARLDPLELHLKERPLTLDWRRQGWVASDLETIVEVPWGGALFSGRLGTLIEKLDDAYCGSIGSEWMHLTEAEERAWVQTQIEQLSERSLDASTKRHLLRVLLMAEGLERYLGAKFPGARRFSLEGTDTLMVALAAWIEAAGLYLIEELVVGMAHRGRLNVLLNLLGKLPQELFREFEDQAEFWSHQNHSGDVKYHQGFSADLVTPNGPLHVSLAFNPSHLEMINPAVCGSVRARLDRRQDLEGRSACAVLIHGDAAFSGQGVVMETLNLAQTKGYGTGGSIHLIVNNQVGFTTGPQDGRSTRYCSDLAKTMDLPVFHVNADDVEAVYKVASLALRYRQTFHKDVVIDLIGYRRQGHNEADEPSVTQPLMYRVIRGKKTVYQLYAARLQQEKVVNEGELQDWNKAYRSELDEGSRSVSLYPLPLMPPSKPVDWRPYFQGRFETPTETACSREVLADCGAPLFHIPTDFVLHSRVAKVVSDRGKMMAGELPIDWGLAENLAYATLLYQNFGIRLSGQDCARGTFFHRHAVWHDQNTGKGHVPLATLNREGTRFQVIDSTLSEMAVMAFEFGYAASHPKTLVIWEAQFGDFANGAQVVIDQCLSSSEQKWSRLSGLVLFLPHGYEGQGPEHSSARIERYLQLSAQNNWRIAIPTTPAQIFHLLRKQMLGSTRKPLIVFTPKSLLRHPRAVSRLEAFATGQFQPVLSHVMGQGTSPPEKILFCFGKIYYDLEQLAESCFEQGIAKQRVALVRLEQLYPFPLDDLKSVLALIHPKASMLWCQDEPENQGAWSFAQPQLLQLGCHPRYVGRPAAAAPAVGHASIHQLQAGQILETVRSFLCQ